MRRDRGRQRDHDRPERHREHEERDADDVEEEDRQPLHDPVGDVDERRVQAGDVDGRIAAFGRSRHDVASQTVDEVARRLVLRRRVRGDEHDRDRLRVVELRLADRRDARRAPGRPRRRAAEPAASPFTSTTIGIGPLNPGRSPRRAGRTRAARSAGSAASPGPTRRGGRAPRSPRARGRRRAGREHRLARAPSRTVPSVR